MTISLSCWDLLFNLLPRHNKGMAIRIVRLGSSRSINEGLRLGMVRRLPQGIPGVDYASRDIYDVWFPNLAPSVALLKASFPADDSNSSAASSRR